MKHFTFSLLVLNTLLTASAQSPCENRLADGTYPCNQITLMSHLSPEEVLATEHNGYYLNDIWGWTDPENNHEYALIGLKDGVSFVDVTDPVAPIVLGKLPEYNDDASGRISGTQDVQHGKSTWRDIKVFQDHAFIVSDLNGTHGMQVFDLTKLRGLDGTTNPTFVHDAIYLEFGSAHNIVINEATGFAYVVGISSGGERCSGGLHIIDINDPKNPQFVNCFSADGYTHDAQCVIYNGPDPDHAGKEICFNSNEDTFTIVGLDDKAAPSMISRSPYPRSEYAHQGWLSEDHKYFLMNDELDESAYGYNPRTLIWKIEDLDNPVLIGEYFNNAPAIDHNLYVHDGLVYESNYMSGLRVLDMARISQGQLRERAYFDTYPQAESIHFGGTWSNYPYFESGNIIVSDMNNGLFVLRLDLEEDLIAAHPSGVQDICEEEEIIFKVETSEEATYQWQVFNGQTYQDVVDAEGVSGAITRELTMLADPHYDTAIFRCRLTSQTGAFHYSFPASYDITSYLPTAAFDFDINGTGLAIFDNMSSGAQSYLWDFGDGGTSEEEHPTHQFDYGAFEITLQAINECGVSTFSKENFIVAGLDTPTDQLNIYPNPSTDLINIVSKEAGTLEVRDASGKLVHSQMVTRGAHTISIQGITKGLYFISVSTAGDTVVKRLLIE